MESIQDENYAPDDDDAELQPSVPARKELVRKGLLKWALSLGLRLKRSISKLRVTSKALPQTPSQLAEKL